MSNLLESFTNQVSATLVDQVSQLLDESKDHTQAALMALLPTLMGDLINKVGDERGAQEIMDIITEYSLNGGLLEDIPSLFDDGRKQSGLIDLGSLLIDNLIGKRQSGVVDMIADFSVIKTESSTTLMQIAASLLMSKIGKQVFDENLEVSELKALISEQKDAVKAMLPEGLSSMGDMLRLEHLSEEGEPFFPLADVEADTTKSEKQSKNESDTEEPLELRKLLHWFLLLIVGVILLLFLMRDSLNSPKLKSGKQVVEKTANEAVDGPKAIMDSTADVLADTSKGVAKVVDSATLLETLNEASKTSSFIDKITRYLNGEDTTSQNIILNQIEFEDGSNKLTAKSKREMEQLAALMNDYANASVKIIAQIDTTQLIDSTGISSKARIEAVKSVLINTSLSAKRIGNQVIKAEKEKASNRITVRVMK